MNLKCPSCGGDAIKVIYMGLPAKTCAVGSGDNPNDCNYMWGAGSHLASLYWNGVMMQYDGGYFKALWTWLRYF